MTPRQRVAVRAESREVSSPRTSGSGPSEPRFGAAGRLAEPRERGLDRLEVALAVQARVRGVHVQVREGDAADDESVQVEAPGSLGIGWSGRTWNGDLDCFGRALSC